MSTLTVKEPKVFANTEIATFIGNLFSFNNSLKLYQWHVTGKGSYAQHIALDQAIIIERNGSDYRDLLFPVRESGYKHPIDINALRYSKAR